MQVKKQLKKPEALLTNLNKQFKVCVNTSYFEITR